MSACTHRTLVLLESTAKKRCRHCHLTLSTDELGDGCCPECLETQGERRYDFEDVHEPEGEGPRYVCEECGSTIGGQREASG